MVHSRFARAGLVAGLIAAGAALAAEAPEEAARRAAEIAAERMRQQHELRRLEEALAANQEARRRLDDEIALIRTDRAKLAAALVDTARQVQATEDRIRAIEKRLETTAGSESAIRRSLDARRGVVVEVLAALQRMGRRPPPALLVRPAGILEAVRSSMLLGAVLPELRAETEALAGDLAELVRLRAAMAADRQALGRELDALTREGERIRALVAARQGRMTEAERTVGAERAAAAELARQAGTLKELIERMEKEVAAAERAAEEARKAAEAQARATRERFREAAFRDPARLAPKIPFSEARGLLPRPVSGETVRDFGAPDGYGGTTRGVSVATRSRATVASPADGWVAFAGPFRSFGRLLIINAGGGYYLLLAGMEQITVEVGQFVLAGEPVAAMGEAASLSPALGPIESKDPVLYIEFRKDGGSIDPGPWWARSQAEKVRG